MPFVIPSGYSSNITGKNEKQTEFVFMITQLTPLEQGVPKVIALKVGV
jgi:Na+/H+-dicarboxylate symporter